MTKERQAAPSDIAVLLGSHGALTAVTPDLRSEIKLAIVLSTTV